jgi:hypothetical protein
MRSMNIWIMTALIMIGLSENVARGAETADVAIISASDPIGWDVWNSGTLTLTKRDEKNQTKILTLRYQGDAPDRLTFFTLSTEQWMLDLSPVVVGLPYPVTHRIKVRTELGSSGGFDELALRIPFQEPDAQSGDRQCMGLEVVIINGRVLEQERFRENRRACDQ